MSILFSCRRYGAARILNIARSSHHYRSANTIGARAFTSCTKQNVHFHPMSMSALHHTRLVPCMSTIQIRTYSSNNNKPPKLSSSSLSKIGAASSFAFLSLSKSKSIFAALKLTKFASLGSMLLSVGAYTTIYGLPFASGMVGLILVHESGHALAMRHYGIPFSPMVFIPFLGAGVAMKEPPKNAYEEAMIALAGPVFGTAAAGAVWGAGMMTGSQLCFALSDFGFMINLFNLIPVGMMDGGRIANALSPYAGVAGVGMAGSMIYAGAISNPIFYLITMAGGYQSGMRLWNQHKGIVDTSKPRNYYLLTQGERVKVAGGYFGLLALLFSSMALNESYKKTPEQVRFEQQVNMYNDGTTIVNFHRD